MDRVDGDIALAPGNGGFEGIGTFCRLQVPQLEKSIRLGLGQSYIFTRPSLLARAGARARRTFTLPSLLADRICGESGR